MMIQAGLAHFEGCGHIVHRSGIVALLLEQPGGRPQNLLTGVNQCLASHCWTEYYRRRLQCQISSHYAAAANVIEAAVRIFKIEAITTPATRYPTNSMLMYAVV